MNPDPAKAQLVAFDGSPKPNDEALNVQFNPATLVVSLSTSIENAPGSGGDRTAASQFVQRSSSTLSVDLEFDTTLDGSDVRVNTKWIAERFLAPRQAQGGNPTGPKKCRFQWGTFAFDGMVKTYSETLEFFSSEGVPLRARLALTLSEDRFQFEIKGSDQPRLQPSVPDLPLLDVLRAVSGDPRDWRQTALVNGIESPRFPGAAAVAVPDPGFVRQQIAAAGAGPTTGFAVGASDVLGTGIRGAFRDV